MDEYPFAPESQGYCRRCDYPLPLAAGVCCPICHLAFDASRPETYNPTRRGTSRWKFWLPGFLVAVASGVISYALCLQAGEMGWALFVAVPISFGAILGYATRVTTWMYVGLAIVGILSMLTMLISLNLAGFFCGATLGLIFVIPIAFGIAIGVCLRLALIAGNWDHRWYFRWYVWAFALMPYGVQTVELLLPRREEIRVVRTNLHVNSTPEEAWNAIMFYEEVQHDPPWLLYLALPKPQRSEGDMRKEGEVVRCFYDSGYLAKRISRVVPGERVEFEVVEQHIGAERNVKLLGGSFEIQPDGNGGSNVVLKTRYQRTLEPTFMWEGTERKVIHTLHGHVLEGMRMKAEGVEPPPKPEKYEPPKGDERPTPLAQR
jgi:hypothetical protein